MADADDKLDFCKQALGELGTRSTITSLDPPDGSQEAYYCNLFFNGTRDQVLRAAHWGFAGRADLGQLWKAAPGTPENPDAARGPSWNNRIPAPPYLYSYLYPGGAGACLQVRRVIGQELSDVSLFSGGSFLSSGDAQQRGVKFEIATDMYDQVGTLITNNAAVTAVTVVTAGQGYLAGDYITLAGGGSIYGNPAVLQVAEVDLVGRVLSVLVTGIGGSFTIQAATPMIQLSTTGAGAGISCACAYADIIDPFVKVILTNARNPLIEFTTSVGVAKYDPLFADAFMLALEGKLALALIGDKGTYQAKLQEANISIINARVRDGNEGLTVYEHVPDWLRVRGISSMSAPASGWYNPPYGPLFSV